MHWNIETYQLKNGLDVVLVPDEFSALVCCNITYKVGSKNEHQEKTGMAHLLEHLMFTGTQAVPDIDTVIQNAGGTNNAFTSTDVTNYYTVLPKENIEVALFLEADRMHSLKLKKEAVEKEKSVVVEEYKERYENAPYGDVIALLRDLVYTTHPYRWSPIGLDMEALKAYSISEIEDFHHEFYRPSNAVLCISGNFDTKATKSFIEKHFGQLSNAPLKEVRTYELEPEQKTPKRLEVTKNVPFDAYFIGFKIPEMYSKDYYTADLLCDLLGKPGTGILYQKLVLELDLCTEVGAMNFNEKDPGMLIIACTAKENGRMQEIEKVVKDVLSYLSTELLSEEVVQAGVVRLKTMLEVAGIGTQDRALMAGLLHADGKIEMIDRYLEMFSAIKAEDIQHVVKQYLNLEKANELFYQSNLNNDDI